MPSVGPQSPTASDQIFFTGQTWTDTDNIFSSNNARATSDISSNLSDYIVAKTFDFSSIPNGSTIDGLECVIERRVSTGTPTVFMEAYLTYDGSTQVVGSAKNQSTAWSTTDTTTTFGGAADTWGVSPTAANVKGANFGVIIYCEDQSLETFSAEIDHVTMTVHYTESSANYPNGPLSTPAKSPTRSPLQSTTTIHLP